MIIYNKTMKKLLFMFLVFLIGCQTINHKDIPFCDDINKTGYDCHSTEDFDICNEWTNVCDDRVYNYSEAICKKYYFIGINTRLRFCFDTTNGYVFNYTTKSDRYKSTCQQVSKMDCDDEGYCYWCYRCNNTNESIIPNILPSGDWICPM